MYKVITKFDGGKRASAILTDKTIINVWDCIDCCETYDEALDLVRVMNEPARKNLTFYSFK